MAAEISPLFDEHLPSSTVEELRNRGVDVEAVYETEIRTASDSEVLEYAENENRVIVTQDSDFLEIETSETGIIFLTEPLEIGELTRQLLKVVQSLEQEEVEGSTIFLPWK